MQVFDTKERSRENNKEWLRLRLLQTVQTLSFQRASGLICLSEYARNYLTQHHPQLVAQTPVQLIFHGTESFRNESSISRNQSSSGSQILRILYVSTVKKYKHQWTLIDAVGLLREEGIPIELHLVGGGDSQALSWIRKAIQRNDPERKFIFVHGSLSYEETVKWYSKVDMFVFPPNHKKFRVCLLKSMKADLPISCSMRISYTSQI